MTIEQLAALEAAMSPIPWEFRSGDNESGDSVDLLMAEVGKAEGDEDEEWAEVLFGNEFSEATYSANWEGIKTMRNHFYALLKALRALDEIARTEPRIARTVDGRMDLVKIGQVHSMRDKARAALAALKETR